MKEKAITSEQMYRIEERGHNEIGITKSHMMENAGHGVADFIILKFKGKLKNKRVVVVCGDRKQWRRWICSFSSSGGFLWDKSDHYFTRVTKRSQD